MASPLQSFIFGEEARRTAERFPLEQAQREVGIERQKQALSQGGAQFNQKQALQGSQLLNQVVQRVKQVQDPNQRLQIFERVRPELQKFGVELPPNLTLESVTDQGLIPLETGLGQTIQQLTTGQRDLESSAQALVGSINPETNQPFTLEQARQSIVARESGIVPRAGTVTGRERAATTPGLREDVTSFEAGVAGAREGAKLEVKSEAEQAEKARESETTFRVFSEALDNLSTALGATSLSGPIAGRLPATTTSAQIADAAKAIMLPTLKQIFRQAGEGTFTDADQRALEALLPRREQTREAQIATIDAVEQIVRAKLGLETKAQALFSNALDREVTEQDIEETLQANPGVTREQLFQQLGIQ